MQLLLKCTLLFPSTRQDHHKNLLESEKQNTNFQGKRFICTRLENSVLDTPIKFQATYNEAKKICAKDDMDVSLFNNPTELNMVSDYLGYIGCNSA